MKRIIKIFLASSIVEFVNERMIIENFIRNISDKFEEHYDIKIQPLLCENFDDAYTVARKQEEYNEKIRESEFCFFIFFTKAGSYTREEFETARKKFEETGKPKIYTYFKVIHDEKAEDSLYEFMDELDKTFTHFYGNFDHIDTVKLRILLALKLQEMDFLEIKTEDGKCVVDGEAVLSLENISEFVNNKYLTKLQAELEKINEEYYHLKPMYEKGKHDQTFYKHYSDVASKRQNLMDEIENLEKMIFNVSMRMIKDDMHGEITQRQKEAYRLFELGDYDGCMAVLDANEIDDEFLREEKRDAERRLARRKKYICEYKTKIEILQVMTDYKNRFDEITECYEKIIPYALAENIEFEMVYDYAWFLFKQNRSKNSIGLLEKIIISATDDSEDITCFVGNIYNLLGMIYCEECQMDKSEKSFLEAIETREKLAKEKPEKYNKDLAISYNNISLLYLKKEMIVKAESYCLKAIEIRKVLVDNFSETNDDALATLYDNIGVIYDFQEKVEKAEECFLKAMNIREVLANKNPERYNGSLADSYNSVGFFYGEHDELGKNAEDFIAKAIELKEKIAKENPQVYNEELAESYICAGDFYSAKRKVEKAEEYYQKAIVIYEALAEENFERYSGNLATSYNNVGFFYNNQGQIKKAEEYYLKAIEIQKVLADKNPERYNGDLAVSYYNFGFFKCDDKYFEEVLRLAKTCPSNPYCRQIIAALEN